MLYNMRFTWISAMFVVGDMAKYYGSYTEFPVNRGRGDRYLVPASPSLVPKFCINWLYKKRVIHYNGNKYKKCNINKTKNISAKLKFNT